MRLGFRFRLLFVVAIFFSIVNVAFAKTCEDAFSANAESQEAYRAVDLESEIAASGLAPHLASIAPHAKGVLGIYDFLKIWPALRSGYLLGLSEGNLIYHAMSSSLGLLSWTDGYHKHRIYPRAIDHTEAYMQAITASGEPIVFLVPRDLMSRESITQREMAWLMANPAVNLKNVYFVFGAYDFVSSAELTRLNKLGHSNALREALRKIAAGQMP